MGVKYNQLPTAGTVASDDYIAVLDVSDNLLKKTVVNHSSSTTAFGIGTDSLYGHVKTVDNLSKTTLVNGEALSARQGNVLAQAMGPLELGTSATSAHQVSDYFLWQGQFVKATRNINVNDTIRLGVNVMASTIAQAIDDLYGIIPVNPSSTEGLNIWIELN